MSVPELPLSRRLPASVSLPATHRFCPSGIGRPVACSARPAREGRIPPAILGRDLPGPTASSAWNGCAGHPRLRTTPETFPAGETEGIMREDDGFFAPTFRYPLTFDVCHGATAIMISCCARNWLLTLTMQSPSWCSHAEAAHWEGIQIFQII